VWAILVTILIADSALNMLLIRPFLREIISIDAFGFGLLAIYSNSFITQGQAKRTIKWVKCSNLYVILFNNYSLSSWTYLDMDFR